MKKLAYVFVLLSILSCQQDLGPEQVLRSYINLRFLPDTKLSDLVSKTTGELKANLESLDQEQKRKFTQAGQFKKKSLKILSRDCSKKSCKITYIISYVRDLGENPYNAQIRNVANLELVGKVWRISSVGGLKSYFESKKDINIKLKSND